MTVYVPFEVGDYLDDISESTLIHEINVRIAKGGINPDVMFDHRQPWTRTGLAADIRAAYYARDAGRLESLLLVLERHEDL